MKDRHTSLKHEALSCFQELEHLLLLLKHDPPLDDEQFLRIAIKLFAWHNPINCISSLPKLQLKCSFHLQIYISVYIYVYVSIHILCRYINWMVLSCIARRAFKINEMQMRADEQHLIGKCQNMFETFTFRSIWQTLLGYAFGCWREGSRLLCVGWGNSRLISYVCM